MKLRVIIQFTKIWLHVSLEIPMSKKKNIMICGPTIIRMQQAKNIRLTIMPIQLMMESIIHKTLILIIPTQINITHMLVVIGTVLMVDMVVVMVVMEVMVVGVVFIFHTKKKRLIGLLIMQMMIKKKKDIILHLLKLSMIQEC